MKDRCRSGAHAVCEGLRREGVRTLFGHPGGAILPLYDVLHQDPELRHVLVRHEQAAAHAADGYARATGKVGVCLATSGPGALNLITGLATAAMDSVPVVAITGQVPTHVMGTDAFQESDILGMTIPITKHGFLVSSAEEVPEVMAEAFRVARTGRPGPVLVDLPKDVQTGRSLSNPHPVSIPGGATPCDLPPQVEEAVASVARLLNEAERPVLMVGRGVVLSDTAAVLRELAERHRLPVVTTLLGLDAFPRSHSLSLGMPGMHGSARANRAIQEADVIVGLGLRFDDRVTGPVSSFAPSARIALFEVDPAAVGRTIQPHVSVLGDLATTLPALTPQLRARVPETWWRRLEGWSRDAAPRATEGEAPPPWSPPGSTRLPTGREATRALAGIIDETGAQVATDVGQHQMWIAQELEEGAPGSHLTSGGLGTMGFALPAALGAALGRPDRSTWVVAGDGGFQMTLQELATVVEMEVPLRIAVVNNGYLGMVRQWQELFFEGRYSASRLVGPDLAALGRAYGIPSHTVTRAEELAGALRWAHAAPGPALLDIRVAPEENVYPMVPPGASIGDLVESPAGGQPVPAGGP